jgi:hypothetical protein
MTGTVTAEPQSKHQAGLIGITDPAQAADRLAFRIFICAPGLSASARHVQSRSAPASAAAAANGSNRIVLRCPRSTCIDTLTCLNDLW